MEINNFLLLFRNIKVSFYEPLKCKSHRGIIKCNRFNFIFHIKSSIFSSLRNVTASPTEPYVLPDMNPTDQVATELWKMSKKSFIHSSLYNVQGTHLLSGSGSLRSTEEHVWIITRNMWMNIWMWMLLPFAKCHEKLMLEKWKVTFQQWLWNYHPFLVNFFSHSVLESN